MKRYIMVLVFTLLFIGRGYTAPVWEIPLSGQTVEKWIVIDALCDETSTVVSALLSPPSQFRGKSTLVVFRLTGDNNFDELWRVSYPDNRQGYFSDFVVTDLDNNGRPEISLLLINDVVPRGSSDIDWMRVYEWNGETFPNAPTTTVALNIDRITRAQPAKIVPGYYTSDQIMEAAILFRGSTRKIYVLKRTGPLQKSRWDIGLEIRSDTFLSQAGILNFTAVRWDRHPLADVLFNMQNSGRSSYEFTLVAPQEGKSVEKARLSTETINFSVKELRIHSLSPRQSFPEDVLLINEREQAALLKNDPEKGLVMSPLKINRPFSLIGSDSKSIITFQRDSVSIWKRNSQSGEYQYSTSIPITFQPNKGYRYNQKQGLTYAAGATPGNTALKITTLQITPPQVEEEITAREKEALIRELQSLLQDPEETDVVVQVQKTESKPDTLVILPPEEPETDIMTRVRNRRMTYDAVLEPDEIFTRNVELDRLDPGTLNLEWIAPEGAVYNFRTGLVAWRVMPNQLDSHSVYLSISDRNDTTRYIWKIYVNDPVKIINKERMLPTTVNKSFSFEIELSDKNTNPEFQFELEGLEGGYITQDGRVHWTPGMEHLDANIAKIRVTDGFSVDSARFMIYVNHPIEISSSPTSSVLPVNRPWQYPLTVNDKNNDHLFEYTFTRPVKVDPDAILKKERISVERESAANRFVNVRPLIEMIDYYSNNLLITLKPIENPANITLGEILAGCLDVPVKNLPHYRVRQVKTARFVLNEPVPKGMEISQNGIIKWTPDLTLLDSHRVVVSVNDNMSSDRQTLDLYVNSPPRITSEPADRILMPGDIFGYETAVDDKNKDARIRFSIGKNSPPAHVDSLGRVVWTVGEDDYDYHQLTIIANDGFARDSVRIMLYVNDPVKIVPPQVSAAYTDSIWSLQLNYNDKNATFLYRIRVQHEDEFDRIEEQIKTFLRRQSVPVMKKESQDGGTTDVRPAVRHLFHAGPDLFIEVDPRYAGQVTLKEIFSGILGKPVDYLPVHRIWRDKKVEFSLIKGPEGLSLNEAGLASWKPKPFQFGTYPVTIRATDAIVSDTLTFDVFVNSPPRIVSIPDNIIHQGDVWQYKVQIEDLNAEQDMEIRLISAPKGVRLYPSTRTIMWSPGIEQKGFWPFEIEVSDGYQTDTQTFKVFVNIPPEITSKPIIVALTGYDYKYQITAEDLNGDKVRYNAVKMPRWAELNEQTGLITWKPRHSERGMNTFRVECIDAHGKATIHEFDVQVFEDPSSKKFSVAIFPLMITFAGILVVAILL